jgi:hypothetical protein
VSAETRDTRTARGPEADRDTRASETSAVATDGDGRAPRSQAEPTTDHDYFTNAVPLRGDRVLREREERIRRLERARPAQQRRRAPLPRIGVFAAAAVVLLAGAVFVLGRSPARSARDARPSPLSPKPATSATPPRIGLAPAVAVATPRPRSGRRSAGHGVRPHRRRHTAPVDDKRSASTPTTRTTPTSEPEVIEPESTAEPEQEAAAEPEPEPTAAPEPEPSTTSTPAKESEPTSSSSEADRQFGFGR